MQPALTLYFDGEKYAGLLLAAIALASLAAAIVMYRASHELRAFALTIAIVSAAELALGAGLYARTGAQTNRLVQQLANDPNAFYSAEVQRMDRVQRNFVVIEYVELSIIIAAAIIAVSLKHRAGLTGVALGLLIPASMLLAFDIIAERRGAEYVSALVAGAQGR